MIFSALRKFQGNPVSSCVRLAVNLTSPWAMLELSRHQGQLRRGSAATIFSRARQRRVAEYGLRRFFAHRERIDRSSRVNLNLE
jgi:hypothetical protein